MNTTLKDSAEPRYTIMSDAWSKIDCRAFLDAANSGLFGRSVWLPILKIDQGSWGEFCLLKRTGFTDV